MNGQQENTHVKGEKITYWRSVDRRERTTQYLASIENEFAQGLTEITSMDRRSMLKVMGASIAISGLGVSCRRPEEKILPYVRQPEDITPGIANFYATAQPTPFGASGLLVQSHEGRPTKVEGNVAHPSNRGKASFINQASVLEVYDPDRSRFCSKASPGGHVPAEWVEWDSFAAGHFFELKQTQGQGLAILCDSDLSPTFLATKEQVKKTYPGAKFYVHEPMRRKNTEEATKSVFGPKTRVRYHFDNAKVIATIFSDPFSFGPDHVRHNGGFSKNRHVTTPAMAKDMNRLYAVEADQTLAGTNADHRLPLPVGLAKKFVEALAYELHAIHNIDVDKSLPGAKSLAQLVKVPPSTKGIDVKFLRVLAKDLASHKGAALIHGGDHMPAEVLALVHVLNHALGGQDKVYELLTIDDDSWQHFTEPGIEQLNDELKKGQVASLIMLGVNPAYDAPRGLEFGENIAKAKVSIHVGQLRDETGSLCQWHLPQTHFLEHFADTRAFDGTISIVQPLIRPLHGARSNLQILGQLLGLLNNQPLLMVKDALQKHLGSVDFDKKFNEAVHDGVVKNSSFTKVSRPSLMCDKVYADFAKVESRAPTLDNLELVVSFDRKLLDGRYANHSWLQELPDTISKICWDNALLMAPKTARALGIRSGLTKNSYMADIVQVKTPHAQLELPVFVMPGLSEFSITTTLGYGRKLCGDVGKNVGVDVYDFVQDFRSLVFHGVKIERLNKKVSICTTQEQFAMNGDVVQDIDVLSMQSRDPARMTDVADFVKNPTAAKEQGMTPSLLVNEQGKKDKVPLQITKPWDYSKGNQWGMVIDLAKCTGCNACVTACQSENNIPVVGRKEVIRGRMMHWIRVDRYFIGDVTNPKSVSQPIPCQHCENAPCEPVCPVAATSHDKEGLNVMTYNRCVGTRYCANNCPYKVRRFNYFDYTNSGNLHVEAETKARMKTLKIQRNPNVTVRYRGVMEKCTFCTQRIQEAKMHARRQKQNPENLPDGAVTPACAQTCPSEAIVFGNIIDDKSRVTALKSSPRNYTMLDILNARPRTSYLSNLRNPHPELVV